MAGIYDFLPVAHGHFPNRADDPAVVGLLGGTPAENQELAKRASPRRQLSVDDPPLLVFHGEKDQRIDVEQARQLAITSEALGRDDNIMLLPGEGHQIGVLPRNSDDRKLVREFFARHLMAK